jgi:hypothetical protein
LSDVGQWWSLSAAPTPAALIAPNRPDKVSVISTPPSLFPRPGLFPVTDSGFSLFYNMLDGVNNRPYQIAAYRYNQIFAATSSGRAEHDKTIVTGTYKFGYPDLNDPSFTQRNVVFDKISMPEGWPGLEQSPIDAGFRFTDDDAWGAATNSMEFDPRFANTVHWAGVGLENSNPLYDQARLFIRVGALPDPTVLPITFDPAIVYPPFGVPTLLEPFQMYDNGYELPPNLLNFVIGQPCVFYFRFDRNHGSTLNTGFGISDASSRTFGVNVTFVDSYAGFALFAFPALTSAALRSPTADFDGDGFSNLIEFAMNSNPADPVSIPLVVPAAIIPSPPGTFTVNSLATGECTVTLTKRPNVGSSLTYYIEHSEDMVTWTRIPTGGLAGVWTENVNDTTTLQVTSVNPITAPTVPGGPTGCFFRVAVTLN